MAFWGKEFIWNGTPSTMYNLGIINFDSGNTESDLGSNVELFTQQVYRKPKVYLLGTSQRPVLEFPLTIGSPDYITGQERSLIAQWLFGKQSYGILQIMECDLENAYFRCFLTDPTSISVGNLNFAYSCKVVCDSPFAWEYPKTTTYSYGGGVTNTSITIFNTSADNDYQYPELAFTLNAIGDSFSLINTSDNNREFSFTEISANETITTDNDRQILTSSTGLRRLSNFNKNWFRLIPGKNVLTLSSALSELTITTQNARKFGG